MPEDVATARNAALPPALKRFGAEIVVLALISELYSAIRSRFHQPFPYASTFSWQNAGSDLRIFEPRFLAFGTPHFWGLGPYPFTYPAPLAPVYWLIYQIPHYVEVYLVLGIAILATWAWYFATKVSAFGVSRIGAFLALIVFLVMAWPVRFVLQLGNTEMIVALILGVGILAALRGRWTLGAVLIGLAASMKLFPFVFLGLMLSRRRYRAFAWGVASAAISTVVSLALLGPTVMEAQQHIRDGLSFIKQVFVLLRVPDSLEFSHSLFNLIKVAVTVFGHSRQPIASTARALHEMLLMESVLRVYMAVVAIAGILLYFLRIRKLPLLNQVLALAVCAVVLPPFSSDYTLIHLLVPLGLLLVFTAEAWSRGQQPRGLGLCFTCLALIFTKGAFFEFKYHFDAQVKTLALLVLLAAASHYRFEREGDPA